MIKYFDFEKSIQKIDEMIAEVSSNGFEENKLKINEYSSKKKSLLQKIYKNLNAWQKVQVARHPDRPHSINYIESIFNNFINLAGDKKFAEDEAIVGGIGKLSQQSFVIIANEKGSTMEMRIKHNFGMARPEGYRKAQRLMYLAEKLNLPIVTFIDTAGAFPGKEAEERGQSESIASSIATCLKVKTPIISIIIGEGGSGGAIALATADKIAMLENSIYSVISPEGCSSILWRSAEYVQKAAESLRLTAKDCLKFGIIDEIIKEEYGGAHRFAEKQYKYVQQSIINNYNLLKNISINDLIVERNRKYLEITSVN